MFNQSQQNVHGAQINVAGDQHIHISATSSLEDIPATRQAYFDYLIHYYGQHVIQGFSPRISGRDVSLPLSKIFLPLKAIEGRPVLAEYAEEDLMRQAIGASGELDWQRHSMEMERRSSQMNVKLSAQKSLSLANLLASPHSVLLGDPGTGKTTITRYITYALATHNYAHTGDEVKGLTPILMRLATYARIYEDNSTTHLIDYVEKELTQRPEFGQYLRYAVENGQCLIILDGLDEVTDPSLRLRVTENIQSLVASYSKNRFLVTSRIVGYDRSPLTREFQHATLSELEAHDRERFIQLWFDALSAEVESTSSGDAAKNLTKIFRDKPQISRLAANPLLLTIMILMYWRGVKLPNRRVQIYENATDTLIEYWTTHRGIDLDAHEIKSILAPIAHHILSSNVGGVIAQHDLLPRFYEGIVKQRGCSTNEAHRLGRNLLRELGEQSGIFLERGLDANGKPVYGFLHQTFGEYLGGLRLAEEVLDGSFDIQKYIHRGVWHEPLLLAAGHLSLISQNHLHDFLRSILEYTCPFEKELHRNFLLVIDCMTEDVQIEPRLRTELLDRLIALLFHAATQLREAALERIRKLTTTRHQNPLESALKAKLAIHADVDSISAKSRYAIAQALVYLDEPSSAKSYQFPLEHELHREAIRIDKVQTLRIEGWPLDADDYLYDLYADKEKIFYLRAEPDLADFVFGPTNASKIRNILDEKRIMALVDRLILNAHNDEDKAAFEFLAAIIPEPINNNALYHLLTSSTSAQSRCFAAIRLLDSQYQNDAIAKLKEIVSTEPEFAPRAATALMSINQHQELDWGLLRDCAFLGEYKSCTPAIIALFRGGQHHIALPAALHLLALYPANTISRCEARLWPVVESLAANGYAATGLAAAKWLALRPGYSYRLQACDAILQAGKVEDALPLYQYLAYECHDETSHEASRKLLLLKELERIVPLLAGSQQSNVPESRYQACYGLALATHFLQSKNELAKPRWELKVGILEERTAAIEHALAEFHAVGSHTLEQMAHDTNAQFDLVELARVALNTMRAYRVDDFDIATVVNLLQHALQPVVRTISSQFVFGIGSFELAYAALVDMARNKANLSIPVYCRILELIARIAKPETAEVMLQALRHPNKEVQQIAIHAGGAIGDERSIEPLMEFLGAQDTEIRRSAIRSLGLLNATAAMPKLLEMLTNDKDEFVRSAAILAIAKLGGAASFEAVQRASTDKHYWVRQAAMDAAAELDTADSFAFLINGLKDEDRRARNRAALNLGRLENSDLYHDEAVAELSKVLVEDEDSTTRFYAAQSLGVIRHNKAIQPLLSRLNKEEGFILGRILWSLEQFYGESEIRHYFIRNSNDGAWALPEKLLAFMLGDLQFTQDIMDSLSSDDSKSRVATSNAVRFSRPEKLMNSYLASLADEEFGIRQSVLFPLSECTNNQIRRFLLPLLYDEYFSWSVVSTLVLTKGAFVSDVLTNLWTISKQLDNDIFVDSIARMGANELILFCEALSIADSIYSGERIARGLIHLRSTKVHEIITRFEKQFPKSSDFKRLRGQAYWQLHQPELALACFHQALEQEETSSNYLAITHYHIENGNFDSAQEYLLRAINKARNYRDDCLLTQAVLYWLTNQRDKSLEVLNSIHPRRRTQYYLEVLKFNNFWRENAISALQEIQASYEADKAKRVDKNSLFLSI